LNPLATDSSYHVFFGTSKVNKVTSQGNGGGE